MFLSDRITNRTCPYRHFNSRRHLDLPAKTGGLLLSRLLLERVPLDRIPRARDLTPEEIKALRAIVGSSFTSSSHVNPAQQKRLIALGLVQYAMGGLMPTPAGRVAARNAP